MSTIDKEDARQNEFTSQLEKVRPVTRRLIEAVLLDAWPNHTAIVDFGIDSQAHYEALYYPIREGTIMPLALDGALGHGAKLTRLTRDAESNPHKDIEFRTSWDVILGREGFKPAEAPPRLPTPSEIAKDRNVPKGGEPQQERDLGHGRDDGMDREPPQQEWCEELQRWTGSKTAWHASKPCYHNSSSGRRSKNSTRQRNLPGWWGVKPSPAGNIAAWAASMH